MFRALKLPEPWSVLLGRQQSLASPDPIDGNGSPRLASDATQKPPLAALPSGQSLVPAVSFPFIFGGLPGQTFHLPTDPRLHRETDQFVVPLTVGDESAEVIQLHGVSRPTEKLQDLTDGRTPGQLVDVWIDWQVWAFQELGHLPEDPEEYDASTHASIVRRSWNSASRVWVRDGSSEARMALIVRLSREQPLHRALMAISRHPRRILQRYRENTQVSQIQELDSACIRDYARRPGISTAEKAGSQQRLLAVRRREQRDTLENRVTGWVLDRLSLRSAAYCSENSAFIGDEKIKLVSRFGRNATTWRTSELLHDVTRIRQIVTQPNYPLQFEARYHVVWKTYLRLLKEKREIDDAWSWQRALWGETGRQLLGCFLHRHFTSVAASTPYYRTESRLGCWTESPVAPGPFQTRQGECLVFDSRDLDSLDGRMRARWLAHPPFPGAQFVGVSGCDQVLYWPGSSRALLVWHFYHASLAQSEGGLLGILNRCGEAIEMLGSDMRRFAQSNIHLSGLLLVADLARDTAKETRGTSPSVALEPGPRLGRGGAVNALCIPPDVDAWSKFATDFRNGVELVFEEFFR